MPSDMPPRPASPIPLRPSRPSEARKAHEARARRPALTAQYARDLRNPRVRATLCYALPLAPALLMLARERRNRFVRLHAAQALVFYAGVGLAQTLPFALVVVLGNEAAGSWAELPAILLLWGAMIALVLGALTLWLRLLADAWRGRLRRRPAISALATQLERLAADLTRAASTAGRALRNTAGRSATPPAPGQRD